MPSLMPEKAKRSPAGAKYLDLAAKLEREIASGAHGDRLPPYEELKRRYRVSQATIDRALDLIEKKGLIARTRRRGVFLRGSGNCQPLVKASIDVIMPGSGDRWMAGSWSREISGHFPVELRANRDAWLSKVLMVLHLELERHGLQMNLMITDGDGGKELEKIRQSVFNPSSGVILLPTAWTEETGHWLTECAAIKPVVQIFRRHDGVKTHFVGMDSFGGISLAVRTLIENGHRRIGMIRHHAFVFAEDRKRHEAYLASLRAADVNPRAEWEIAIKGRELAAYDREIREYLTTTRDLPTAFCCQHNIFALLLETTARELGIAIPAELSIVGYGDPEAVIGLQPRVSFVVQPTAQVIAEAIGVLSDTIRNPAGPVVERRLPVDQLEAGETLARAPGPAPASRPPEPIAAGH